MRGELDLSLPLLKIVDAVMLIHNEYFHSPMRMEEKTKPSEDMLSRYMGLPYDMLIGATFGPKRIAELNRRLDILLGPHGITLLKAFVAKEEG